MIDVRNTNWCTNFHRRKWQMTFSLAFLRLNFIQVLSIFSRFWATSRLTFLRSLANELDRRCAEAFNRNRRGMRMAGQKIGQRFRVCFVGFPCTNNAAMSWYWFEREERERERERERDAYNERQPLTVYPLIFSRSRYGSPKFWVSPRAKKKNERVEGEYRESDSPWCENDCNETDKLEGSTRYRCLSNLWRICSTRILRGHKFVNPRIIQILLSFSRFLNLFYL